MGINFKPLFKHAISAPIFESDEKTHQAQLLNVIIWIVFIITFSGGLAMLFLQGFDVRVGMSIIILLGLGGVYGMMRRGHIQPASLVLVLVLSTATTISIYRLGGLRFPAVSFYILIMLIAGLLLNLRLGLAILGAFILAIFGFYYAEIAGFITYTVANEPLQIVLLTTIVVLAVTASLIYLYTTQVRQVLERARRHEAALQESNSSLQQEIVERFQAEKALQEANAELEQTQALLRTLIDNVPAAIMIRGMDGRYSLANRQAADWSGYTIEEIIGSLPHELFPLDVRGTPQPVSPDTEPAQREFEWPGPDKIRTCYQYRFPIFNEAEDFYGICLFIVDITLQTQLAEALRENEAYLRAIINNIPFDLWVCDAAGRYIIQNAISNELAGDLTGKTIEDLDLSPELKANYRQKHLQALNGYTVRDEVEIVVKDQPRIFDSMQLPIRDGTSRKNDRRILGFIGMQIDITERRQAEEQLQFQKTLLECQGEAAIDGILVVSPAGEWLSYNQRLIEMWDIPEEVVRQRSSQVTRQLVRDKVENPAQFLAELEYLDQHPFESDQSEVALKDGRVFERYSAPVRSAAGEHYGRVWYYHDITERKRTELTLRRRAEEMTVLYETSLEMNAELELSALLPALVRRAATLLGVEMGALLFIKPDQKTLETLAVYNRPPGEVGQTIDIDHGVTGRVAKSGEPLVITDYRNWSDRPALVANEQVGRVLGVPLKQSHQVVGVLNVFDRQPGNFDDADIQLLSLFAAFSAIIIQNVRLFEAEQHHREIAETLSEIARVTNVSLNLEEVLLHVIEGLKRILAYDSLTVLLIEAETFRYVATTDQPETGTLIGRVYPMSKLRFNQYVVQTRQAQLIPDTHQTEHFSPVTKASSPVQCVMGIPLLSQDNIIGVMSIGSYTPHSYNQEDVQVAFRFAQEVAMAINNATLYQQIQQVNQELEEKVIARTKALEDAQERLIRQEKLAFLGQLAGGVGHELRNPLGVVTNAVYYLQMVLTEADETVTEYLNLIADRVHEADKIVSDLLNLSRNRATDKTHVTLRPLVDEVLARHPAPAGVTVNVVLEPDLPTLFVDPQQIRQVLTNLVTNAYQAMPKGGMLTITTQEDTKEEAFPLHSLGLIISDTGEGMLPATLEKIFEPLYTTKSKGIGLGLAVSKNLTELNGGTIFVESIAGHGTIFRLALPISESSG